MCIAVGDELNPERFVTRRGRAFNEQGYSSTGI
jgi:hypothetical protein